MTNGDLDAAFLKAFEACTIPSAEWKHRSHLKVAYLYLCQYPFAQALDRIRANIQRYNAATNTPESLERGYHETMTVAWLQLVDFTLRKYGPAGSADEFLDAQQHFAAGCEVVITGHFHVPIFRQAEGKTLIGLGDWIDQFSYAVCEDGVFTLRTA